MFTLSDIENSVVSPEAETLLRETQEKVNAFIHSLLPEKPTGVAEQIIHLMIIQLVMRQKAERLRSLAEHEYRKARAIHTLLEEDDRSE